MKSMLLRRMDLLSLVSKQWKRSGQSGVTIIWNQSKGQRITLLVWFKHGINFASLVVYCKCQFDYLVDMILEVLLFNDLLSFKYTVTVRNYGWQVCGLQHGLWETLPEQLLKSLQWWRSHEYYCLYCILMAFYQNSPCGRGAMIVVTVA